MQPMLMQMRLAQFGNLQQRINRRLRKYRQEKITSESSFNKNEGRSPSRHSRCSVERLLFKEAHRPGSGSCQHLQLH
jgi:hypothetical protein